MASAQCVDCREDVGILDDELADGSFCVKDLAGKRFRLPGIEGYRLMEIMRDFGVPIAATCGGAATCGTCHVFVDPRFAETLPPPNEEEEDVLDRLHHSRASSRLACQIIWRKEHMDGMCVALAPPEA